MGQRGPMRTPGSQRWRAELKKQKRALALGKEATDAPEIDISDIPTCPRGLSRAVADRWMEIMLDLVAAGIAVKQIDSRCIAVAARHEDNLERLDQMCERNNLQPEVLLTALRSRQSAMKEYLAALEKIGGTPLVRMRASIAPKERTNPLDDPWSSL